MGRIRGRNHARFDRRWLALAAVFTLVAGCNSTTATPNASGASGAPASGGAPASAAASALATAAPAPVPTAADLIQADVAAGKIDQNTATLYRLEAQFGAPGVPSQYGSAPAPEDMAAFDMAALNLAQMPADIHDQVAPFLLRPTNPNSVFHGKATSAVPGDPGPLAGAADVGVPADPARPASNDTPVCGSDGWASVTSESIPVTVWGECGSQGRDDADLTRALSAIESTYPDEVKVMGDPIPDDGTPDAGGSPNIDIYLIDSCVTRAGTCHDVPTSAAAVTVPTSPFPGNPGSRKSSAYILLWRSYNTPVDLKDLLTHEMFHVLEDAHNQEGRAEGGSSYWMTEACAEWAEETFVPEGRSKWVYPDLWKFQVTPEGLTDVSNGNAYSDFIWPYFMDQESSPDAIGTAWKAFEGKKGWQAFNDALTGVLSFKDRFKDFAVRAWNSDLPGGGSPDLISPRFQVLDGSLPKATPDGPKYYYKRAPAVKKTDPAVKVPETMAPLSARYAQLSFDQDVQQLIVDFSGLQPQGAYDVVGLVHTTDGKWQRRDLPAGKTTFCRNQEDVDRVIFVFADHSYQASGAVSGTWQYQAVSDPCTPGSFTLTLKNVGLGHRGGQGSYTGDGPVDCSVTNGVWHATFGSPANPVNNIRLITIAGESPAYVTAITTFDTDSLDWQIQNGAFTGSLVVTADDKGGKNATIFAHGTDLTQSIDASLVCTSVERF